MKKLYITLIVLFLTLSCCFAQNFLPKGIYRSPFEKGVQNKTNSSKSTARERYLFTPTIGYGNYVVAGIGYANVMPFGLDFMYATKSGFAVWFNNTFFAGRGTIILRDDNGYGRTSIRYHSQSLGGWSGELLLGYSKEIGKHSIGIGGGIQAAIGSGSEGGETLMVEVGIFTVHFDYSYFFTENIGAAASITDGLGIGFYGNGGFINAFSLKLGPVFKI